MNDIRETLDLLEAKSKHTLEQIKLPYSRTELSPVLSQTNLDLHYGKLYKGYVDRYNSGEGDPAFNEAGAFLHEIFFSQFRHPTPVRPLGRVSDLINCHFGTFVDFKEEFKKTAMTVQGSGWCYLAKNGTIKKISNHAKRTDVVILVDMWEHSYQTDYSSNKSKYLDNLWRILDWDAINRRL